MAAFDVGGGVVVEILQKHKTLFRWNGVYQHESKSTTRLRKVLVLRYI